jgi:spermidine synthase
VRLANAATPQQPARRAEVLVKQRAPDVAEHLPSLSPMRAVFVVSVAGLFLEMLLIRWISTEVRVFAYLQNSVLVVCFLGLGLGCLTARRPIDLRKTLVPLAVLVLFLAVPPTRYGLALAGEMLAAGGDVVIWAQQTTTGTWQTIGYVAIGLAVTFLLLVSVVDIFVPLGRLLGRLVDGHPDTLRAYSVNVAGSLIGTWLFVLLSFWRQPPLSWFAVLAALLLLLVDRSGRRGRANVLLLVAIVVLSWAAAWAPGALSVVWSPYQKLVAARTPAGWVGDYLVAVNNTGYQTMVDLSAARVAAHPELFPPETAGLSQYDIPLLLHPSPRSFLVVGAGTGNDVAGGLRHGVERITAVEIDPEIIALGRRYHPEAPYRSPLVRVVDDDARSFFARCRERFDVISFGLLDSHTTTAMTNARLDHYVYTRESIARARALLAGGGVMVLSFEAQKPFIADRMARVLRDVFGQEPIVFRIPPSPSGWGGLLFVSGDLERVRARIAANPRLSARIHELQQAYPVVPTYSTRVATDDWPYIYLDKPRLPLLYVLLAVQLTLMLWRSYAAWGASGVIASWDRNHWHFFLLGAAFLLLEVQNVSKASVVLGNTWQVNAVIVSGVLAMILLANLVVQRFPGLPLPYAYAALVATCLGLYFVDLASFAFLDYPLKAAIVGGLTALPMLFSGIAFARSFTLVTAKDAALGANLIGALAGGLLQSITFLTGVKALLLVVAVLYLLSLLTRPATSVAQRQIEGSSLSAA